ncbi:MAG: ATP-binding cassette domain-containing protein [Bacteroidetes bacterium]|nr:ATP-binding cassette domain-containing protein [Bacteroidota bacterium]MBK9801048.1 ATP-binding cassette domain-containing protein [Bacteroidota bacterium]MBP6412766.1 ATP-binding cassette domain-containing protein [Bacteroidia bacterium]
MIQLVHVTKVFNAQSTSSIVALNELNLEITEGQFIVVVGANGSGKSTLLNLLAGSMFADTGRIMIDGNDVTSLKDYERSKFISRIYQNPITGTAPDLSILDNFRIASLRTSKKQLRIGIDDAFRKKVADKISVLQMGLENKLDVAMGLLSGGQRQALTLLMSVMDTSKVLLLDEPTAALDPKSALKVMELTQQLVREYKLTAVLITHEIKFAHHYGDRIIQLAEGQIKRDLNSSEKKALSIQELFEWFL